MDDCDDDRKGTKRPTSERDDNTVTEEYEREEPGNKFERLEAKKCRVFTDIYNSDTG